MKNTFVILFLSFLTPLTYGDFEVTSGTCEQQYLNMIWGESDDGTFNMLDQPEGGYSGWVGVGSWGDLSEACNVTARKWRDLEYDSDGYYYVDVVADIDFDITIECDEGLKINGSGIGNCKIIDIATGSTIYNGSPANLSDYQVEPGNWRFQLSPNAPPLDCYTSGDKWYSYTTCSYYGECSLNIEPDSICNDITGDDVVNVSDLLNAIADWGEVDSPADVNNDGDVNVQDLLILIGSWGACP